MENKKTEQQQEAIKLQARILMREFEDEETNEVHEYVAVELPDPFGDEDFRDIGITPRWKDQAAIFKFKAKKALKTTDVIDFEIDLKPVTYKNKEKKKEVTYPGLVCVSPFDGRTLEFYVKGDNNRAIFSDISYDLLGLRKTDEDSDA